MAKKTGSILDKLELNIDEEKISLINFYIKEDGDTLYLEAELSAVINNHIDKLYKKKVPKSVRHYIENKDKEDSDGQHSDKVLVQPDAGGSSDQSEGV